MWAGSYFTPHPLMSGPPETIGGVELETDRIDDSYPRKEDTARLSFRVNMSNPQSLRYLVTGGAGFIGSHLTEHLLADGHHVSIIDNLSTGRVENLAAVEGDSNLVFVQGDVGEEALLSREAAKADIVVHLAAAVGVKLIVEQPLHSIEANVLVTEKVMRIAAKHRCGVLIASSSEVYGKSDQAPFAEDDDVVLGSTKRTRWSYAATKMVGEFLALAYHKEFGLSSTVVRFFNTIGPRQSDRYGMVAPRFVRQALRGNPITVYGEGTQSRCFCDVRDVVRAVSDLSRRPEAAGEVYNVGSTREISIRQLAELVRRAAGSSSSIVSIPYEQAYEPGFEDILRRVPNTSKVSGLLGWKPTISLEETLAAIIEQETVRLEAEDAVIATTGA